MTAGQNTLGLDGDTREIKVSAAAGALLKASAKNPLLVIRASVEEREAHQAKLKVVAKSAQIENRQLVLPEDL